jgi:acetyl-CoA C-acetyltransferase
MLQTAEQVIQRYNIPKLAQDEYGVRSQQRAFAAQQAGKFKDEIVPMTTVMGVVDKASGRLTRKEVTIDSDEGIRGDTTLEAVSGLRSALPGGIVTAGNASQFSDGASAACVLMNGQRAEQRGIQPLGIFRGFAVAGCEPDEMGIGPVFAVPRLLQRSRAEGVRHRPVGAQRGLRLPGAVLPRQAGHPRRTAQCQRRRHRGRPPLRRERRAAHWAMR